MQKAKHQHNQHYTLYYLPCFQLHQNTLKDYKTLISMVLLCENAKG